MDSSVAAYLLKERGYEVIGGMMYLHDFSETVEQDLEDAATIARQLQIPFHVFDEREAFAAEVIQPFVSAYENGLTPNPCVTCNRAIKFGRFFERADELGCDFVATGHYARIAWDERFHGRVLKKASDPQKDQSYVLYPLTRKQLERTLLPLGELTKSDARELAAAHGLLRPEKGDSQDICFIPDGNYVRFIKDYTRSCPEPGDFVDPQGVVLGRHRGLICYTIGQRKGLGIAHTEPLYVCGKTPADNTVTLCVKAELNTRALTADQINLLTCVQVEQPLRLTARTRYHQAERNVTVIQPTPDTLRVVFDEPCGAVAPGQSVVLYDEDVVFGGGRIIRTETAGRRRPDDPRGGG